MTSVDTAKQTEIRSSRRRIRIVHVQLLSILSGVQRVTLDEFSSLDQEFFELHLICQSPGPLSEAASEIGVQCHFADRLQRHISPTKDYQAYRQIRSILQRIDADVVHTHSSKTGLLGRLAATHEKVPAVVHTVHGFAFPITRRKLKKKIFEICERVGGKNNDALVVLNQDDENIALEKLNVGREKVFRVVNGVCLEGFQAIQSLEEHNERKSAFEQSLGIQPKTLVVQVGRLWEQKNPRLFVDAACQSLADGVDANFVLVGDGPLAESLQNSIDQRGYGDNIHLAGWRDDVKDILPLADMLVLSSSWEGMPLVLLEASACGVPAIATNIAGSRDCIDDGVTGFLVNPKDTGSLSDAITRLHNDDELRSSMSKACRAHVEEFHDVLDRHRTMQRLYAEILERKDMHDLADIIHEALLSDSKPDTSRDHANLSSNATPNLSKVLK